MFDESNPEARVTRKTPHPTARGRAEAEDGEQRRPVSGRRWRIAQTGERIFDRLFVFRHRDHGRIDHLARDAAERRALPQPNHEERGVVKRRHVRRFERADLLVESSRRLLNSSTVSFAFVPDLREALPMSAQTRGSSVGCGVRTDGSRLGEDTGVEAEDVQHLRRERQRAKARG